jgi:hypothetical protein
MKNSLLITGLSYLVVVGWGCVPMLTNGVSMAIASLPVAADPITQTSTPTNQKKQPIRTQQTKRLKIEIDVTSPGDLMVKEGQTVTANQLIADRKLERSNLSAQLQEIKLSLERLKLAPEVSQVPPAQIKMLTAPLPSVSYIEEKTQVTWLKLLDRLPYRNLRKLGWRESMSNKQLSPLKGNRKNKKL